MKTKFYTLSALLLLAAGAAAPAATPRNADGSSETVIVPFDATKPLDAQKPDSVYVPYERFVELWEAAKAAKRGVPPEQSETDFVLGSARYDARLTDKVVHVTGVIELQTFKDDWVSVPLAFADAKIGSLKLDGNPAPLQDNALAIEKAGHHRVEVEFEVPLGDNKEAISWGVPRTAGTLFTITLPDKQMKATVEPGNGMVERISGNQKITTAALGSTDKIDLTLDSSVGLSTINEAAVATVTTTLGITPAVEQAHSEFEFSFPESRQDHFVVRLDPGLALVKLDVPNLKSWKLSVDQGKQTLEVTLVEPAADEFKFSVDSERTVTGAKRDFPRIAAAANRAESTSAILASPLLEVTPKPADAFRQISFTPPEGGDLHLVAAYSSTSDEGTLSYEVAPAKPSMKANISYVYQVNHSKIELVSALKLREKNQGLFDLTVGLPADFSVQAVESDRLKDWWLEGTTLHARFKGAEGPEGTQMVVHLVKQFKTVPDALEITPLTLPAEWEVEGDGIIAASSSVKAAMTISDAKEINPENAATDFRILPPMERKRGFSFKGQAFHASVKLDTLPARVDGTWVMSAQAHENWVSVSTHVSLTAKQGSAPEVRFRLPATVPEGRVTGGNVRETTSAIDGAWRVYRVAFQNDLTDQTDFALDFDLPGSASVSLPQFEIMDMERSDGFVIVDNVSEYEMQTQQTALEPATNSQIPFLPQVSLNAKLFRVTPGWTLQIALTRLEKEAGRSAFVEWADLTTAFRPDGSEWHRASYHLQNRSLQYLPVKLPAGCELVAVSVAGENVRADRGTVDGKEALLIPLLKSGQGDASYDVNVIYRNAKTAGRWTFRREALADPEVIGITVELTLWNLYLPEGTDAGNFGGNMEEVIAEVNKTEKMESIVGEVKRLRSLSLRSDAATRQKAEYNIKKLTDTLEKDAQADDSKRGYSKPGGKDEAQYREVAKKKKEIQKELEEDKNTAERNAAQGAITQTQVLPQSNVSLGSNQAWSNNGNYTLSGSNTYTGKTAVVDQKNPEGKQVYVNDFVVNVNKDASSANNSINLPPAALNNAAAASADMSAAGDAGAQQKPEGQEKALQQLQLDQVQAQATFNSSNAAFAGKPEIVNGVVTSTGSDSLNTRPAGSGGGNNENVKVLGNARGNVIINAGSLQVQAEPQQRQTNMQVTGASSSFNTQLRSGGVQFDGAAGQGQAQGQGYANGNVAFAAAAAAPALPGLPESPAMPEPDRVEPPAQLQAAGSISLPVDFPLEGHAYHFKKLKSNAKLTVWITNERGFHNWEWIIAFLVAAAAIKYAFRFADKNTRRRLA